MTQTETPSSVDIIFYETPQGAVRVEIHYEDETFWLTQAELAALFQVSPQNITLHLKNIYSQGELDEAATCKEFLQVQFDEPSGNSGRFRATETLKPVWNSSLTYYVKEFTRSSNGPSPDIRKIRISAANGTARTVTIDDHLA